MIRLLLALVLLASPLAAQVVETPTPFDSAGRVMAVTPLMAARLSLGPPAWRVVGDFTEARLFSIGGEAYVLVVHRRDGSIERYSLTGADREYLRERISMLPPSFFSVPDRSDRGAFIRNQTILGLLVYAPSFAAAITDDDAGAVSAYLLVAGASFFGASQLARQMTVTNAMRSLSTHGSLHAGAAGGAIAYSADGGDDAIAASVFAGSLAGTAAGLYLGRRMTPGEAVASGFGADVLGLTTLGVIAALQGTDGDLEPLKRSDAALLVVAAGVGYPLGYRYARRARYLVTGGDVGTLWISGLIGASAIGTIFADENPNKRTVSLGLTAGFLGGIVAGDRIFVRRFDHSSGDAALMGLGGVAGGLIGLGIANLIDDTGNNGHLDMGLFTAGAAGGVALTQALARPGGDAGRSASHFRLSPTGAALAATGVRGHYPIVSISF